MNLSLVGRQPQDKPAAGPAATAAPANVKRKRESNRLRVLNLATLAFILAYLIFDYWAISYLVSHH